MPSISYTRDHSTASDKTPRIQEETLDATYPFTEWSPRNHERFCVPPGVFAPIHDATAAHQLGDEKLVRSVKHDFGVTGEDVEKARREGATDLGSMTQFSPPSCFACALS